MPSVMHPIIDEILSKRGLSGEEREFFLNPQYEKLHNPFLFKDMEKAVVRIGKAVKNGEIICIYSDYDADGIPAGVLLRKALETEQAKILPYVPDRHTDGFGFHESVIPELKEKGVSLIITVDCGIAHNETVATANKMGIDVIITDHHENQGKLPEALAIIDPVVGDESYPFKGLCGTGVAFKLVQALQQKKVLNIPSGQEKWFMDLVAIATIADMVPLTGENRILVYFGLKVIQKTKRAGLRALISSLRLRDVTEDDVAFSIAPRINAASRMGEARLAYDLLYTDNENEAISLVRDLEKTNNSRKGVVASIVKEAHARIDSLMLNDSPVIVMGSTHWRPSLLGLVATNLVDKYDVPVFLWGEDGSGEIRGSCRGNGTISVHELMTVASQSNVFLQYGGHKEAGGFTLLKQNIPNLAGALIKAKEKLTYTNNGDDTSADAVLSLSDINNNFLRSLFFLKPFGLGNEKPLFHFPKAWVDDTKTFGKTGEHLEVLFSQGNIKNRAIKFFIGESMKKKLENGTVNILGHIEEDPFRGRQAWRVRIVEIK